MSTYQESLARYDELVAKCPRFDRKGKSMPFTSANGYMFSLLNKAGELGIRFSKEVQAEYFNKFNTSFFKSYGATMQGYILIPEDLLEDTETVVNLLNQSYEYVMSLEPK